MNPGHAARLEIPPLQFIYPNNSCAFRLILFARFDSGSNEIANAINWH